MADAYLGVGSNLEPEKHLPAALAQLQPRVVVVAAASVYRTAPIGRPEQPDYLNTVWHIQTDLLPRQLKFEVLRPIEVALGRMRTADRYRARTIDLDLLLYDDLVVQEPDLTLPDPDIRTRPFIAIPLHELNPALILPDSGEALAQVIAVFDGQELECVSQITHDLQRMVNHE